jgi:hypothetical protein
MRRTQTLCLLALLVFTPFPPAFADVYLHEGFNGTGLPPGWRQIRLTGTQAAWSVVGIGSNPNIPPYAGTGQAKFNSFDASVGEQARLISPRINLSTAVDPFVIFFMYHDDEYPSSYDSVYVEATTGDSIAGPWVTLLGVRRPEVFNAWRKEVVSLYTYRGANRVFLSLRGVSRYGNNMFVDELRVADSTFHDIGIVALMPSEVPSSPTHQEPPLLTEPRVAHGAKQHRTSSMPVVQAILSPHTALITNAIVRNFGTFSEPAYSISWRVDNVLQPPAPGGPLAPRTGLDTTTLVWLSPTAGFHTFTAWTVLPSDSNRSNDTAQITAYVLESGTVFYELFNGSAFPPAGWLTINRDGGLLPAWFRGDDTSAFLPFEGSGFAANNFQRANGSYLDDYLISPQIPGVGQPGLVDSLVFRVRSPLNSPPAMNFPDSLMVLLSTGGADTSSFTIVLDYFAVPKGSWTRKAYSLAGRVPPNSTIRVAFRYLLYNVQPTSGSGDFVGIDVVQIIRGQPASVEASPIPTSYALGQNYPNPFNPTTTIKFSVESASGRTGDPARVTLKVYDVLGREVVTLVNEVKQPGTYTVTFDGEKVSSGVYVYQLRAGEFVASRKMLLLR